ncbi:DUF2630 family protein [Streptomyces sp. 3MP-14]|uniref:DUF2630 family protein n=1 Tax=Streptomyces mimosae TaxID=2586635 RepID=A0A5N6AI10_9ACTN|nr:MULTISPECIES: DUF2630 family protein [Streptomyces]KAB8167683.1 DUF2630 family protein [Streptomyces mimosae]KAB8177669.1 DUF2630 family protein [Streptomyces sp. 3MP-14]
MDDKDILARVDELVAEERALRDRSTGRGLAEEERVRLSDLEVRLDQCWDLLRQRRARDEFGANPNAAVTRPAREVEGYES